MGSIKLDAPRLVGRGMVKLRLGRGGGGLGELHGTTDTFTLY